VTKKKKFCKLAASSISDVSKASGSGQPATAGTAKVSSSSRVGRPGNEHCLSPVYTGNHSDSNVAVADMFDLKRKENSD
jgi:hypothetical protein